MPQSQTVVLELPDYKVFNAQLLLAKKFIQANPDCTNTEAAAALGVTERTLYRWASAYKLELPRSKIKSKKKTRKTL